MRSVKGWLILTAALAFIRTTGAVELELSTSSNTASNEEAALYYYAAQGDNDRVLSEARRLRALNPDWSVPEDLFSPRPAGLDTTAVWRALAREDLAEAAARLAALQATQPDLEITDGVDEALALGEAVQRISHARDLEQWQTVRRILERNPALLSCQRIDMLWEGARAELASGRTAAALGHYKRVISECGDSQAAIATLEKAWGVVPEPDHDDLVTTYRQAFPGREAVLDSALADLRGNNIGARIGSAQSPLPEALLTEFAEAVTASRDRREANLIGWYHFRMGDSDRARSWFHRSNDWGVNGKALEGLTLVALERERFEAGERRAAPWLGRWKSVDQAWASLSAAWITSKEHRITEPALQRVRERHGDHPVLAETLGWRDYRDGSFDTAFSAFNAALDVQATPDRLAGAFLSARRANQNEAVERLEAEYADRGPDFAAVFSMESGAEPDAATEAWSRGDAEGCYTAVRTAEVNGELTSDISRLGGWCLLALERNGEAKRYFMRARALAENPEARREASYGIAVVEANNGEIEAALRLAERADVGDERLDRLQADLFAERAVEAFQAERYEAALVLLRRAPRTRELEVLRAWAHFQAGEPNEAYALFEQLDATLSTEETRLGMKVTAGQRSYRAN